MNISYGEKENKISYILWIALVGYYYISPQIFYASCIIYIIYYSIKLSGKLPFNNVIKIYPLLILYVLGAFLGMTRIGVYNTRDILRDMYSFSQPIVFIYMGILYKRINGNKFSLTKTIVMAAVTLSCLYLYKIMLNPYVLFADTVISIRSDIGKEYLLLLVATGILLTTTNLFRVQINIIVTIVVVLTFVLQFSRASFGQLVIILCIIWLLNKEKFNISVSKTSKIVGSVALILLIIWVLPSNLINDFYQRILKSVTETSINVGGSWGMDKIQQNWRAYEQYRVVETFNEASLFNKIFGFGFGKDVDLGGILIDLGGNTYSSISVFHNGYGQVLIKTGVFGIILLLYFFAKNIHNLYKLSKFEYFEYESKYAIALLSSCLFLTYVKGGLFRGGSLFEVCFFIGYISYHKFYEKTKSKSMKI